MHEDLLRHVWSRQMFDTSQLTTSEGHHLRILSPGILSRHSGPDFRSARIELNGTTYTGDIEFHRQCSDWELHGHQEDEHFNSVILHVVLQGRYQTVTTSSGRTIPTLILEPYLFSTVAEISDHLSREEYATKFRRIPCEPHNDGIPASLLSSWLQTMYRERLREKVGRMQERLDDIITGEQRRVDEPAEQYEPGLEELPPSDGKHPKERYHRRGVWEQLLYEEIMDCLGYSNNRIPMKLLAEHVPLHLLQKLDPRREDPQQGLTAVHLEAVLFRASGLLPKLEEVADTDSKVYVHSLTTAWKELHDLFPAPVIHPTAWNFSPTRPANFPTIRIAAASVFVFAIMERSLFRSVIAVVEGRYSSPQSKMAQLASLLDAGTHPFWNFHYAFTEASHQRHSILGKARVYDIIVNALIPFILLFAIVFRREELSGQCLNLAAELPLLEENSIERTLKRQLLRGKLPLTSAYQQQGMIQLYKRYYTEGRCSECSIGNVVMNG